MFERMAVLNRFAIGYLRQIAADIADEDLAVSRFPGQNPPGWILGHLAVVADYGLSLVKQPARSPREWRAKFGPGSQPSANRGDYPAKGLLLEQIEAGYATLAEAARQADPKLLDEPHGFPPLAESLPTRGDMLAHLLTTHLASHVGQLSQWRRQQGAPPLF